MPGEDAPHLKRRSKGATGTVCPCGPRDGLAGFGQATVDLASCVPGPRLNGGYIP